MLHFKVCLFFTMTAKYFSPSCLNKSVKYLYSSQWSRKKKPRIVWYPRGQMQTVFQEKWSDQSYYIPVTGQVRWGLNWPMWFGNLKVIGDPGKWEESGGDKCLIGRGSVRMEDMRTKEGKSCCDFLKTLFFLTNCAKKDKI